MRFSRGISPVIATVIIVAVAIAIAIAVAFWMGGIVGIFTRYEKLEIINAYADWNSANGYWYIVVQVKNAGSSDATIDEIFINGKPHNAWSSVQAIKYKYSREAVTATTDISTWDNFDFDNGVPLKAGKEMTIVIKITGPGEFKHGASVEVKVHTAGGKEYPKEVVLP